MVVRAAVAWCSRPTAEGRILQRSRAGSRILLVRLCPRTAECPVYSRVEKTCHLGAKAARLPRFGSNQAEPPADAVNPGPRPSVRMRTGMTLSHLGRPGANDVQQLERDPLDRAGAAAGGMQQLGQVPARSTRLLDEVIHQRVPAVNESGMDARRVISERANEGISCNPAALQGVTGLDFFTNRNHLRSSHGQGTAQRPCFTSFPTPSSTPWPTMWPASSTPANSAKSATPYAIVTSVPRLVFRPGRLAAPVPASLSAPIPNQQAWGRSSTFGVREIPARLSQLRHLIGPP